MFWCFVGLEAFAHLASEFKNPERDFPRALMIGLLLAGLVYWGCTVVVYTSTPMVNKWRRQHRFQKL